MVVNRCNYATAFVTVQPVKAALTWSDQPPGIDPSYSETLNLNNDIENPDGIPDNQEPTRLPGDADVRTLTLGVTTGVDALADGSTVTLSLPSGRDMVRLWQPNATGVYDRILTSGSKTWTVDYQARTGFPGYVLVEGMNVGDSQFQMDVAVAGTADGTGGAMIVAQPSYAPPATTQGSVVPHAFLVSMKIKDNVSAGPMDHAAQQKDGAYLPISAFPAGPTVRRPLGLRSKQSTSNVHPSLIRGSSTL